MPSPRQLAAALYIHAQMILTPDSVLLASATTGVGVVAGKRGAQRHADGRVGGDQPELAVVV
jgi:hypothetical protein